MNLIAFGRGIKDLLIVAFVVAAVWFFKDYQHQKAENIRQSENMRQIRMRDSLKYAQVTLDKVEILDELKYTRADLTQKLKDADIKIARIQRIVSTKQTYEDTAKVRTELKGLALAVSQGTPMTLPVIDSTDCWFMQGVIEFDGEEIFFDLLERRFKNATDVVTYWERNQWSFLGLFKTRLFGKKQVTVKIFNTCGETETYVIENKNLLKQ